MCVLGRSGGGDSLAQTTLRGSPSRNDLASRSVEPLRELATKPHPPLAQDVGGNGTSATPLSSASSVGTDTTSDLSAGGTEVPKCVLVIGSGPVIIGQAAEFDYAGTQACRALREEGIRVVLVNSNPATIMTDDSSADAVYVEPLTVEVLERVIIAERPDGLLATLGGQTGLNLAVALDDAGVLGGTRCGCWGRGCGRSGRLRIAERFKELLTAIGEPAPESATVSSLLEARALRDHMGLPLVVRPAFTLGGTGGGLCDTEERYAETVLAGLAASPISQVLIERSVAGWREIEYEVIRDAAGTCITVCNMENLDPMGVHTGDSMVVAPAQTLTDREHQQLRSAALAHHQRARDPGRLQRAVRAGARFARVPRHRGEPAGLALVGARVQGDRLSDRAGCGEDRGGTAARRDSQRRHRQDVRRVRAGARLLRRQDPALAVRQVPRGRPAAGHADEVHRRGDGDRAVVRGGLQQGSALARAAATGPFGTARTGAHRRCQRPARCGAAGSASRRRDARGSDATERHLGVVPAPARHHRCLRGAAALDRAR